MHAIIFLLLTFLSFSIIASDRVELGITASKQISTKDTVSVSPFITFQDNLDLWWVELGYQHKFNDNLITNLNYRHIEVNDKTITRFDGRLTPLWKYNSLVFGFQNRLESNLIENADDSFRYRGQLIFKHSAGFFVANNLTYRITPNANWDNNELDMGWIFKTSKNTSLLLKYRLAQKHDDNGWQHDYDMFGAIFNIKF